MSAMKKILASLLVLLILATIGFIFYNSTLPPEESAGQSNAVGGIIAEIISPDTELGGFIQKYLRKIAHFTEYGLLGVEFSVFCVFIVKRKIRSFKNSLFTASFVALVDETIQIFSKRGPSVEDIWIDIGGYVFFSLITVVVLTVGYLVCIAVRKIRGY